MIKIYMAYNEEKGKSCEDLWGLGSFYFMCVLEALYYQGACIEKVGEVQIIKKHLPIQLARKLRHIRSPDRVPVSFVGHV
jgi:hypothetical protein